MTMPRRPSNHVVFQMPAHTCDSAERVVVVPAERLILTVDDAGAWRPRYWCDFCERELMGRETDMHTAERMIMVGVHVDGTQIETEMFALLDTEGAS